MEETWKTLVDSIYHDSAYYGLGSQVDARPTFDGHGTYYTKPDFTYDMDLLLECCDELLSHRSRRDAYNYDLVNFYSQWLANYFWQVRDEFTAAYKAKDLPKMEALVDKSHRIFADIDDLLGTHPDFLLGKWIADARALGADEAEKAYYERNARTLLTIWGGPILNDYANRLWNGLVKGYYQGRWDIFFDEALASVREGRAFNEEGFETNLKAFEEGWNQRTDVYPSHPVGKTRKVARRIRKDIDAWLAD